MNYHNITHDDMLNGDGLRVVLWVSGCNHKCRGCQNPVTWDENDGVPFDLASKKELFDQLSKDYISGITFSGGDPLYPNNREAVERLVGEIKERFADKTIWIYTGYSWEQIKDTQLVKKIDVLVDGEYIEEKRNVKLHWVGSSNQRVIDVQASLALGGVVPIKEK